ncbi:MAG: vWA domain-containing protein [Prolixibacteraceae bacterium]
MKTIIALFTLLIFFSFTPKAQEIKKVYGYVKDGFGNALENAEVSLPDNKVTAFTDSKGWYSIEIAENDSVLEFSHKQFKKLSKALEKSRRLDVNLIPKKGYRIVAEEDRVSPPMPVYNGVAIQKSYAAGATAVRHVHGANLQPQSWNTENYATIQENGFRNVNVNPLSTFSIDVDNASYSNVRRFINQGELPPVDAVRVEELINYFSYDYPEPDGEHPFSVTTELGECPWNEDNYLLHVGLKGKSIDKSELPPSNLVFLIDVSGSMNAPNKLPLLKRAFRMLVDELRPEDKVSIVVYAGAAGKVLDATSGDEKKIIMNALDSLYAGGSTAGGEGLKLAYKIASENFIEGGNNRIMLATDGDFNVGVSSTSEMERLVEKERENGVFMSVLGFGAGNIKDYKMETIANKGNGNYSYIDNIQEARKVFVTEFGGTLFTIAKDVKFQLEFNPQQVEGYRLVGYENRLLNAEDFNDDAKDAGEMGAGHTVTALYEIIPAGSGKMKGTVDDLKYQNQKPVSGKAADELLTIKLRYKAPDGDKSRLLELPVDSKLKRSNSADYRFSAAVASYGMLLRGSEFMGITSVENILKLAKDARGKDEEGYRSEFIQLVKTVNDLGFFDEE